MAYFKKGNDLNAELELILEEAEEKIILISPYIKLHDRYISALKMKLENPKLRIVIVFGKNDENFSLSMKEEDFNFFKEFPNIQIRYEKRLHAKYYANELYAILTSMNLHRYSQDNNIEAGIVMRTTGFLHNLANKLVNDETNLDKQAWEYFSTVIKQSDLLFEKIPDYDKTMLRLTKKYKGSIITVDKLSEFFADRENFEKTSHKERYEKKKVELQSQTIILALGYCIRTGKQIPFNINHPMSDESHKSWSQYSNKEYKEKYCHFSGEPSNGETSFAKPILRKYWGKAKETHGF